MLKPSVTLQPDQKLDHYFQQIDDIILSRQDPLTGLLPASTSVNSHGDYTDAWVRDNVYAIQAAWALGIAYRKMGCNDGRAYLLEQSVVKVMRGLLIAMMKQADKVERFKHSRDPNDALHAKYNIATGDTVVADDEWGHLQLDATGIFMLMLAQMTKSGLRIVFTIDEVNFVQNLVYYLARAYGVADFGIWERGNKTNDGRAELNASSLGIVKAALEAMRGLNLFGGGHCQEAVIHVVSDEIAQARIALENLLPRESNSKETDAALLAVIGYPAFAVEDKDLVDKTRNHILEKLGGQYGCKRFLLDGHQTALEDTSRLHYEYNELKKFEHIESEWPLFFAYLFIDAQFRGDYVEATHYKNRLQELSVEKDGLQFLPELYFVPLDKVPEEKNAPGSQQRTANDNLPLIWAQSLYYVACLLDDDLISINDIDPLRRHARVGRKQRIEVQIALLAESEQVKNRLLEIGVPCDMAGDIDGVAIKDSRELSRVYGHIGFNKKLQLSGRPIRRMRIKMTSQIYRIREELVVFMPYFQNQSAFHVNLDNNVLIEQLAAELNYLVKYWDQPGKPLVVLAITETMLQANDSQALLQFLEQAKAGELGSARLVLGSLNTLIHNAGCEKIKEVHDLSFFQTAVYAKTAIKNHLPFDIDASKLLKDDSEQLLQPIQDSEVLISRLRQSTNLYEQIDLLEILMQRHGLEHSIVLEGFERGLSIKKLIEEVYQKACDARLWGVIRRGAGLLDMYYDRLDVSVQEILMRQKQLLVGRSQNSSVIIDELLTSDEIHNRIKEFCVSGASEAQMNQEVLFYLGLLIKEKPELFEEIVTIRTGHLLLLCVGEYANEMRLEEDEAFAAFAELSPNDIKKRLVNLLSHYQQPIKPHQQMQELHYVTSESDLVFVNFSENDDPTKPEEAMDWLEWRKQSGIILSTPKNFHEKLWDLLERCNGIVIGDRYNSRSRLDTHYAQGTMTRGEHNFVLLVDRLLNEIYAPEYRYLTVEAIMSIAAFIEANPGLKFNDYLVIDTIVEYALQLEWAQNFKNVEEMEVSTDQGSLAWKAFYRSPPHRVACAINMALEHMLLKKGQTHLDVSLNKNLDEEPDQSMGL